MSEPSQPKGQATTDSQQLVRALTSRGVRILAPHATVIEDIDPDKIEAGVELYPGCTLRGPQTQVGRGSRLGLAGGGYFENVAIGRHVDLYGGYFKDAVFLDGVIVRGHAEMRGGTLMEEGSEAGHHVGYKMTITMPNVVAGSLINFCDALVAGGTSRRDHSEIGSCLALYNFTPWGDKFASLLGDVPNGVFLRSPRIFVGGQAQVVSPVSVGYGAMVPAGAAVRRSVPAGRMVAQTTPPIDSVFDANMYGGLGPKFDITRQYVGNLWALLSWYRSVRRAWAGHDTQQEQLFAAAERQIRAGISERTKRLARIVERLPESIARHRARLDERGDSTLHRRRIDEHNAIAQQWPAWKDRLTTGPASGPRPGLVMAAEAMKGLRQAAPDSSYIDAIGALSDEVIEAARDDLQRIVDDLAE